MRKKVHIGSLVADMHSEILCVIANVAKPFGPFVQGQRLYLATPHELDSPVCEVRYRNRQTGKLQAESFPWPAMKEVRVAFVAGHIAARCWRDTPEVMQEVVQEITKRYCPILDDFSADGFV